MGQWPWIAVRQWRVYGARVYVHWAVLVVVGFLGLTAVREPVMATLAVASYLGVVFIHECGHLGYLNLTVVLVNIAPGGGLDGETAWNLRALRDVRRSREPRRR